MIGAQPSLPPGNPGADDAPRRLGGPLVMLGMVLAIWIGGRAVLWEDPLGPRALIDGAATLLAERPSAQPSAPFPAEKEPALIGLPQADMPNLYQRGGAARRSDAPQTAQASGAALSRQQERRADIGELKRAMAHEYLWLRAVSADPARASFKGRTAALELRRERQASVPAFPAPPAAKSADESEKARARLDRWSLTAWAFAREGSNAAPISQGRVPVYGASQVGGTLQYRLAPASRLDPRAYVRAYRALVERPESELAIGLSAKPARALPVRVYAEVRGTDDRFGNDVRPAVFAVTEIPPQPLPLGLSAEIYAGAGYVGGDADTGFVDGQAVVTRELTSFDLAGPGKTRISLGAGAWGGAQRDANRLDIGPTMRLDLALGNVPARFSIDYREQVGGDASPRSGLAATLSTQF